MRTLLLILPVKGQNMGTQETRVGQKTVKFCGRPLWKAPLMLCQKFVALPHRRNLSGYSYIVQTIVLYGFKVGKTISDVICSGAQTWACGKL